MLIFTNPVLKNGAGPRFSRQNHRSGAARQALASLACVPDDSAAGWKVAQADSDADDDSMQALLPMFQGAGSLLVYLHGYNATPTACFERCDRLHARYGLEVVRFSWSKNRPPDDIAEGSQASLAGSFSLGSNRDFTRLCAADADQPVLPCTVAAEPADGPKGPRCSWWVLMALTGQSAAAH